MSLSCLFPHTANPLTALGYILKICSADSKVGPDCIRKIDLNKAELLVIEIIKLGTDQMVVEDRTVRPWGWMVTENTNHPWVETVGLF